MEKITNNYEKRLIRKLLQADQETRAIYGKFIERVSPILARYRADSRGIIVRNADLERDLLREIERLRGSMEKLIQESQAWAWGLSNDKTDEILEDYLQSMAVSKVAREGLFMRNEEAFRAFQLRKYDGRSLSSRVWDMAQGNKEMIDFYLENGLSAGKSANKIAQDLREFLNEPDKQFRRVRNPKTGELDLSKPALRYNPGKGVYRGSVQNARRLARNEVNMAYRSADGERWKRTDFILGYEVKLSNRHPKPDICDHAKGQYPKEFKFVGWHVSCLCKAVPILPDKKKFLDYLTEGEELTGQVKDIPEGMKNWIRDNKERVMGHKTAPFFVQDNFVDGRIDKGLTMIPKGK